MWDYPRPPRLEPTERRLRVELGGVVVADTRHGFRVLETSHPPAYYLPPSDCALDLFREADGSSWCEWKGSATYWTVVINAGTPDEVTAERAAWSYRSPTPSFASVADHVAFYPSIFDCFVDDERVTPQPGEFYGGWVTSDVVGPFKGAPGSSWW